MTEALPIACSLGADDLKRRLVAIAEIGAESLLGREADGLDLTLEERRGELVLTVAAPQDGQAVVDELASAFDGATA